VLRASYVTGINLVGTLIYYDVAQRELAPALAMHAD
jgi:hypothetical protein